MNCKLCSHPTDSHRGFFGKPIVNCSKCSNGCHGSEAAKKALAKVDFAAYAQR